MKFFRSLLTKRNIASAVLAGMVLRSLIATGFMLDTQPADGSWVSVKICPGPGGINAVAGLSAKPDPHHQHHNHNHGHDKKHDHSAQDHSFTGCNFWSASGLALSAHDAGLASEPDSFSYSTSPYRNPLRAFVLPRVGKAREPPILS